MKFNKLYYEPYKDIFGIHQTIKTINQGFRLYFNKKDNLFSIINIFNNFEICYSFKFVFKINLNDLRFSKIENLTQILNLVEKNNNIFNEKCLIETKNKSSYALNEFIKLSNRSTRINNGDINKIIGATQC